MTLRLEGGLVHYTFYASLDAFNNSTPEQSESVPLPASVQGLPLRPGLEKVQNRVGVLLRANGEGLRFP